MKKNFSQNSNANENDEKAGEREFVPWGIRRAQDDCVEARKGSSCSQTGRTVQR